MSEYSTEKVLQWVNSSEAKAAKYEQEAKDLRRKIDNLRDKIISCQEEIYKKYEAVDIIDQQIENLENGVIKRREGMEILQTIFEEKLDQVQKIELKYSILDGTFLNEDYQESLKPSSFISDVQSVAERSKRISLKEIQNYPSKKSSEGENIITEKQKNSLLADYKEIKKNQNGLNSKRNEIEMNFKKVRASMRMSLSTFSREKEKLNSIVEKSANLS